MVLIMIPNTIFNELSDLIVFKIMFQFHHVVTVLMGWFLVLFVAHIGKIRISLVWSRKT